MVIKVKDQNSKIKMDNELLERGIVEIIDKSNLSKRLASGDKLRVKLGIDPTSPDLHLGHTVPLRKLRQFQDAGHTAVLIIGDFTARIGDPSGRDKTRPSLSDKQVKANAKAFKQQAFKILNPEKTEVRWQSKWYGKFGLDKIIELTSKVSTWHLLSHETFGKRKQQGHSLMHHETLYPLLQGYDSVAIRADVELGGVDQKFNLLTGRIIQQVYGLKPQDVVMVPYLLGINGKEKMSKSLGNTINLNDSPKDIFGKVMSIPDNLVMSYFELVTDLDFKALKKVKEELKDHPRDAKAHLAFLIVESLYDAPAAQIAQSDFNMLFRGKMIPEDVEKVVIDSSTKIIIDILIAAHFALSRQQATALVKQGGVSVNGDKIKDPYQKINTKNALIKVGKRRFVRLVLL